MGMSANPSVQRNCCHAIGYLQSCCLLPRSELWKSIGSLPHEHKLAIVGWPQMQLPIQYYSHMSFFSICSLNLSHLDLPLPLSNAENYPQMCSTNGNDGSWNVSWRISASKWNLLQLQCWKTYNPLMRPIDQIAGLQHSQATASLDRYRALKCCTHQQAFEMPKSRMLNYRVSFHQQKNSNSNVWMSQPIFKVQLRSWSVSWFGKGGIVGKGGGYGSTLVLAVWSNPWEEICIEIHGTLPWKMLVSHSINPSRWM